MQFKTIKNALLFIDANILLDFYRSEGGKMGSDFLKLIDAHKDILITGSQIAMEYKKNRQSVLSTFLKGFKSPDSSPNNPPPFLIDSSQNKTLIANFKAFKLSHDKVKRRIELAIEKPQKYDPVYISLKPIFNHPSQYNLDRSKIIRNDIRELAKKRFMLGYPPRKQGDTSIGDAINWEWIIHCASKINNEKHDVILVTRDNDFGHYPHLNDWLKQEFKERVGKRKNIYLINSLSTAFKMLSINVKQSTVKEEMKLIENLTFTVQDTNALPLNLYEPGLPSLLQALADSHK